MNTVLRYIIILGLLAALGCLNETVNAQESKKPKVALVLSGGSAHGLAHIGVIEYLEELGIKPDLITGTSMGAVIGGLYALGYTADEIRQISADQDWDLIMSNRTPLDEVAPVEKQFHGRIPLSLYWKDDSFKLPAGIIRGQRLDINLSSLFVGARDINHFDDLHIPYRCVAIDLQDGSIDVFDSGYIAEAIRASMAIPSVFPPKEINNTLYVDGGLIRNFPVEEARAMGADIVIGVYVGGVRLGRNKLNSIFDILEQSAFMGGILDSDRQSRNVDILITPKVKTMGKFDFLEYKTFIERGYEAATQQSAALKKLAQNQVVAPRERPRLTRHDSIVIEKLEVRCPDKIARNYINRRLMPSAGSTVSVKDIEENLAMIYGTKNFSKTAYSFDRKDSVTVLQIQAQEANPYNLGISLNRFNRYNAALILNAEARNVAGALSNVRIDARVSEYSGIQMNYYKRLAGMPTILFRLRGKFESYAYPFINEGLLDRLYDYREADWQADIVKEWRNKFMFSIGYQFSFDRIKPEIFKSDDVRRYKSSRHAVNLGLEYSNLDRQVFARRGTRLSLSLTAVLDNKVVRENQTDSLSFLDYNEPDDYVRMDYSLEHYYSFGPSLCLELSSHGRLSGDHAFLDQYKIGGPFQSKSMTFGFPGLEESEFLIGDHFSCGLGLRFLYKDFLYITPVVHFLHGKDLLSFAYERDATISLLGGGLEFGIDTPIGPVSMDAGYTNLTEKLNLNLGIGYRHIF